LLSSVKHTGSACIQWLPHCTRVARLLLRLWLSHSESPDHGPMGEVAKHCEPARELACLARRDGPQRLGSVLL